MILINWLRKRKIIRMFRSNAVLSDNIKFGYSGVCKNLSGDPLNIKIGEGSFIMGSLYVSENGQIDIGDHFYLGRQFAGWFRKEHKDRTVCYNI